MISKYQEQLDRTRWSYSRIHTYAMCPASFKMIYLDHCPKVDNAFGQFGSLCHSILEDYENGKLFEYELEDEFEQRWNEYVKCDFPLMWNGASMGAMYYEKGKAYFSAFEGYPSNWEIIGAEIEAEFEVGGRKVIGFIDLLVRDKNDGKLIVVDHKSKAKFRTKKEQAEYAIQLYLYAKWVFDHYGEYPKELIFNMFREKVMVHIPFDEEHFADALRWVTETVDAIYADTEFKDKITLDCESRGVELPEHNDDFFCKNLCSCRDCCERMMGE